MNPAKGEKPKSSAESRNKARELSVEERAAIREHIQELTTGADKAEGESAVLSKISQMSEHDRDMAKRIHSIIKASAPSLSPRLWYGMPAYSKDDKVICFFQAADKFKARYGTLGFSDKAKLDEGDMWPNSYALKRLTAAEEARIVALVKKAVA